MFRVGYTEPGGNIQHDSSLRALFRRRDFVGWRGLTAKKKKHVHYHNHKQCLNVKNICPKRSLEKMFGKVHPDATYVLIKYITIVTSRKWERNGRF